MRDYAQYTSRLPSPKYKTPLKYSTPTRGNDRPEGESTSTASSSSATRQSSANGTSLNASDALSMRQHGAEATIQKLRQALDESQAKDATAKSSLAKSDAVILELRSTIRQLKRQIESKDKQNAQQHSSEKSKNESQIEQLQKRIQDLQNQLLVSQTNSNDANMGELQIQLDRAHAQILTADMVRKELEDTLEAEQYTWELRIQDQERTIADLQQQCDTLTQDLQACRSQWKEAEVGWNAQVSELQQQLTQARTRMATTQAMKNGSQDQMMGKITQLENERAELQNCLDEALQELEAVDAELSTKNGKKLGSQGGADKEVVESLQRLLRWIWQESSSKSTLQTMPRQPKTLLNQIQKALEEWIAKQQNGEPIGKTTKDLRSQLRVYEEEIQTREESSLELRESLKEAVALLKPLQDAVAKAEVDKKSLQDQLVKAQSRNASNGGPEMREKNFKIQELQDQIVSLQEQVEEHKQLATARESLLKAMQSSANSSRGVNNEESMNKIQRAREELRRKRETEGNLQQLLRDAQSRFHSLHQQNEKVVASNRELQGKLKSAEQRLTDGEAMTLEEQLARYQEDLAQRDAQLREMQFALDRATSGSMTASQKELDDLSKQLMQTQNELAQKEQAESILNRSLKDALGLLKPLQMHLEEAEKEKMEISKELRNLRKRFRQLQMGEIDDLSRSTIHGEVSVELIKMKEELEETVRQLELENSQLHEALDDVTDDGQGQSKMRQRMVELSSRYEVTQNKLEDAHVENHSLIKQLKQKELEEKQRKEETKRLYERLLKTESELHDAKAIVDEFTLSNGRPSPVKRGGVPIQRQMV